jgi:glycosyltransferase involved in cell wall biosynthesis
LTHPHSWTDVRRGAERELRDFGSSLSARGHRVTVVTGMPGGLVRYDSARLLRTVNLRTPLPTWARRRGWSRETAFAPWAALAAAGSRADVVHCLHYADAWGAIRARPAHRRRPVVLKLTGTVKPHLLDDLRIDRRMFLEAVAGADEVWCNSPYARDVMAEFGREMHVVPAGVDLQRFRRRADRETSPLVVCTSSPSEPRKRLVDLVDAWGQVRSVVPEARLILAGPVTSADRVRLLDRLAAADRPSVTVAGSLDDDKLVELLSRAHVVVSPAVQESLGLATLEALACGTPVVGARSGATPALIPDGCGATFEPLDPVSCAAAVLRVLDLVGDPGIEQRCRGAAGDYDLERITTVVEQRYLALTGG